MKSMLRTALTAVIIITGAASLQAQSNAGVTTQIQRLNSRYFNLFNRKDLAIVALYTDDAYLMSPNAPAIRGKAAITKDFRDTYAAGAVSGVKFTTQNVFTTDSKYAVEDGTWQVFDTDKKIIDNGKYVKLWKQTPKGWRILRDIFNSDRK